MSQCPEPLSDIETSRVAPPGKKFRAEATPFPPTQESDYYFYFFLLFNYTSILRYLKVKIKWLRSKTRYIIPIKVKI